MWSLLTVPLRAPRRGRGFWYGLAIDLLWPLLLLAARIRFVGKEHLGSGGGVLVVSNHLSYADAATVAGFCLNAGRVPRFLAKESLWRVPVVRWVVAGGGHIPVHRGSMAAVRAFRAAVEAVQRGECVVVFPEGGFSDDPDHWPSSDVHNGVARMALQAGVPVVPLANWGSHELLPQSARFPRLWPRRTVTLVAGPPVDLADLAGLPRSRQTYDAATKRIMVAVTELLAEVRQR